MCWLRQCPPSYEITVLNVLKRCGGRLFLLFVVFEIRQNREHAADHRADCAAKQKKLLKGTLHITTPFRKQKRAYKKSMYNPLLKEGLTANTSKVPEMTPEQFHYTAPDRICQVLFSFPKQNSKDTRHAVRINHVLPSGCPCSQVLGILKTFSERRFEAGFGAAPQGLISPDGSGRCTASGACRRPPCSAAPWGGIPHPCRRGTPSRSRR